MSVTPFPYSVEYNSIRENALAYSTQQTIYEFDNTEEIQEQLDKVIAGKVLYLDFNSVLHSCILDDNGLIIDVVYLAMFENKYWLICSKNAEANTLVENQLKGLAFKNITEETPCLAVEGPYSWKVLKTMIDQDIAGLQYLDFMEKEMFGYKYVIVSSSRSGEYGYRIYSDKEGIEGISKHLAGFKDFDLNFTSEMQDELSDLLAMEVKASVFESIVDRGSCPVEYDLRWFCDFQKEEFSGKDKSYDQLTSYENKLIGFAIDSNIEKTKEDIVSNGKIVFDGMNIGFVKKFNYSPALNKCIGYAMIHREWAYTGISEMILEVNGNSYAMSTKSSPMLMVNSITTPIT